MLNLNKGLTIFEYKVINNVTSINLGDEKRFLESDFWVTLKADFVDIAGPYNSTFITESGNCSGKTSIHIVRTDKYVLQIECGGNWVIKIY